MAERATRGIMGAAAPAPLPPAPAPAAPQVELPGAAAASTPPAAGPIDTRGAFDAASAEFQVPANLLMAISEAAEFSPEESAGAAGRIAQILSGPIGAGRKHSEALAELFPDAPPEFAASVVARSNQLYADLYGPKPEPGFIEPTDADNTLAASVIRSAGSAVRGVGQFGAMAHDAVTTMTFGDHENQLAGAADTIQAYAKTFSDRVSPESKAAIADSTPGGDLFKPSTWELGDAPSVRGYGLLAVDVLGSMLPIVAASVAGPGPAALVGGAMSGGAGAESAAQIIDGMAAEKLEDGRTRLEAESAYYRELIASGMEPERALKRTKAAAERMAFLMAAPIGAIGGAATSKILDPATKLVGGGNRAVRAAGRGVLGATEEGAQEVAESVAAKAGTNAGAGTDESLTEGTFGDFLLGAIAGGGPAAIAGGMSQRETNTTPPPPPPAAEATTSEAAAPAAEAAEPIPDPVGATGQEDAGGGAGASTEPPSPAPTIPPAPGAPTPAAPTPDAPTPAPAAPAGPMQTAMQAGPAPVAPDLRPGDKITITPEGVSPINGVFVSETPAGVRVKDDTGQELEIERAEIESGFTKLQLHGFDAQPPVQGPDLTKPPVSAEFSNSDLASRGATWRPAPEAPIAPPSGAEAIRKRLDFLTEQGRTNGWRKDISAEKAALTQQLDAIENPPAPKPTPTEIIAKKDGTAFKSLGQAKQAVIARGFEPSQFEFRADANGAYKAYPIGMQADTEVAEAAASGKEGPQETPTAVDPAAPSPTEPEAAVEPKKTPAAKATGPETGDLTAEEAAQALTQWIAEGKPLTGGFATTASGKAVTVSFDQWFGGNRVKKPEGKVFITGPKGSDAFYFDTEAFDTPEGKAIRSKELAKSVAEEREREAQEQRERAEAAAERAKLGTTPKAQDAVKPDPEPAAATQDIASEAETSAPAVTTPNTDRFVPADHLDKAEKALMAKYRGKGDADDALTELDAAARRAAYALGQKGIAPADHLSGKVDGGQDGFYLDAALGQMKLVLDAVKADGTATAEGPADGFTWEPGEDAPEGGNAVFEAVWGARNFLEEFEQSGITTGTYEAPGGYDATAEAPRMDDALIFPAPAKTANLDTDLGADYVDMAEAEARLESWKAAAKAVGATGVNKGKAVLSLFDYSGQWAQPWRDAGYQVIQHDIKAGSDLLTDGWIYDQIEDMRKEGLEIYGVLSACPCTTFAVSGARWWAPRHDVATPEALAQVFGEKALSSGAKSALEYNVMLFEASKDAVALANPTGFHALENPVGRIEKATGLPVPTLRFNPHNFGDPYTKRTGIYGSFKTDLPTANVDPVEGSKMQSKLRGDSALGKEARSETPEGFAYAFFMANDPAAMGALEAAPAAAPEAERAAPQPSDPDFYERVAALAKAGDKVPRAATLQRAYGLKYSEATALLDRLEADGIVSAADALGRRTLVPAPLTAESVAEAAAQADPNPTDAQKEAGNYKMKHVKVHGLDVSIETEKGQERAGFVGKMPPVPAGHVRMYRGQGKAKVLPEWIRQGLEQSGQQDVQGRWFTNSLAIAMWYVRDAGEGGYLTYVDVPRDVAKATIVADNDAARRFSRDPDNEYLLPRDLADAAKPTPVKPWSVTLAADYGYIRRTEGADGDHLDVYVGDFPERDQAYVFDQFDPSKTDAKGNLAFDEHKVVLGAQSLEDARRIYDAGFSDKSGPARRNHAMPFPLSMDEFKGWIADGDLSKPIEGWKAEPVKAPAADPAPADDLNAMFDDVLAEVRAEEAPKAVSGEVAPEIDTRGEKLTDEAQQLVDRLATVWQDVADAQMSGDIGKTMSMVSATMTAQRRLEALVGEDLAHHIGDQLEKIYNDRKAPKTITRGLPKPDREAEIATAMDAAIDDEIAGKPVPPHVEWLNDDFGNWSVPAKTQLYAASGRALAPAPAFDASTPRKRKASIKRQREWLIAEAKAETEASGNGFVGRMLERMEPGNVSRSDMDTIHDVLFGEPDGPTESSFVAQAAAAPTADLPPPPVNLPSGFFQTYAKPMTKAEAEGTGYEPRTIKAIITRQAPFAAIDGFGATVDEALEDAARKAAAQVAKETARKPAGVAIVIDPAKGTITSSPVSGPKAAPEPTAGAAAASAVKNVGMGLEEASKGLLALFNGKGNKLSSGFTFDAETYAQAKPMFLAAARSFAAAGADIRTVMKAVIRHLVGQGLNDDGMRQIQPYVVKFVEDVQSGAISLDGETDDAGRNAGDNDASLDDVSPEGGESLAGGRAGETGESGGGADASGDLGADVDRSGPGDGVVGHEDDVLPDGSARLERPDADGPVGRVEERPHRLTGDNPGNYAIPAEQNLGGGSASKKVAANIAAIKLYKAITAEGRFATPEEQATLSAYVGWGGLKSVFDVKKADATDFYGKAYRELKELLTRDEYEAAFDTVRNAHYTADGVVHAMWRAMRHFGYDGGRALEPTMGVGNFLGLQPADLAGSTEWHAAELDSITGGIAKLLYPEANVYAGTNFRDAPFADGVFDIAIGNPPFGSNTVTDKTKQRGHLSGMKVHNYVLAKTAMHLRPGGVMAMVVTHRFLDTANDEARSVLAKDFAFMGAVRLPSDAFKANAGTEVTTDIIFLRRLRADEKGDMANAAWLDVNGFLPGDIRVNRYFAENPTHILGTSATDGKMYGGRKDEDGKGEYTVHSDGRDLGVAIDAILAGPMKATAGTLRREGDLDTAAVTATLSTSDLPVGGMALTPEGEIVRRAMDDAFGSAVVETVTAESYWKEQAEEWNELAESVAAIKAETAQGSVPSWETIDRFMAASKITLLADGTRSPKANLAAKAAHSILDALTDRTTFEWSFDAGLDLIAKAATNKRLGKKGHETLTGMLGLRQALLELLRAERADAPGLVKMRAALNARYDAFVKAHGYVSDKANVGLLQGDVGAELGLEAHYSPAIGPKEAAEMGVKPEKASAVKSAILSERVYFPTKEITTAADPADATRISLSERGRIDLGYMAKLLDKPIGDVIKALAEGDSPTIFFDPETNDYQHSESYLSGNVKHKLAKARENGMAANVKALAAVQPDPKTQDRIQPTIRSQWMPAGVFEAFLNDLGVSAPRVTILSSIGKMEADAAGFTATPFGQQFMHENHDVHERASIIKMFNALAVGKPLTIYDSTRDGPVVNQTLTGDVNAIMERMATTFREWAYADSDRAKLIVDAFNEKMNTHRRRSYDGETYLRLVGAVPEDIIKLRRTQKNAAWRMILDRTVLLDHVVGAGKTFTIAAAMMERKRLGLSRKPLIAVPNHLVTQWAREFYLLYPGAKLLAATPDDFAKKNRRRLLARIATGNYDAIIIGHTSLGFIETPIEDVEMIVNEAMDQLRSAMEDARTSGASKRTLTQLRNKLESYEAKLDKLRERAVDEIGVTLADMGVDYLAVDEAHEFKNLEYSTSGERVVGMNDPNGSKKAFDLYAKIRGMLERGGGVGFATGTPVSNSLIEIYTVMKYLAHSELENRDQSHFDAWSAAYSETQTRLEYTATQKIKPRRVLAGLSNLSALTQLYQHFADTINMDDIKRIYAEEQAEKNALIRAHNAATGESLPLVREQFPVPRVKDGGRALSNAPISALQEEYMDYLVARMEAIQANASDKDYPKIDNPLWVLSDARKMSLDIRTVDPMAERDGNGKVTRAAANIKRTYDEWQADLGTQMVFCDLSTPSGSAVKAARKAILDAATILMGNQAKGWIRGNEWRTYAEQWERLEELVEDASEIEPADMERLAEITQEAEAVMLTADTGFSVYDDMKKALIESGIPEHEIAFIHDYNTPEQKAKLFARVNAGLIRVLMGSSPKMGAGTNAQKRLVALHHMDAPWRPSDVEQREGRIIRQGNMLYERDPDGFEVEILAYSASGTSDTVMWQILERKAGAIEQFRAGDIDRVEEEGGDSDQYAEFMASSTGNPVFRLKLEAERSLVSLRAEIGGLLLAQNNARSFLREYDTRHSRAVSTIKFLTGAEAGDIRIGEQVGDAAEFATVMAAARAEFEAKYAAYAAKWNEWIEIEKAEIDRGVPEKDRTKRPEQPSRPGPISKAIMEKSSYARVMHSILMNLRDGGDTVLTEGKIGGLDWRIRKRLVSGEKLAKEFGFSVEIDVDGRARHVTTVYGVDALRNDTLTRFLTPDGVQAEADELLDEAAATAKSLEKRKPAEEANERMTVDQSAIRDTQGLVQWYSAKVALAETEADRKRASRSNRYIGRDRKRAKYLSKGGHNSGDTEVQTFEFEGHVYQGTGLATNGGTGGASGYAVRAMYEATRKHDGWPAVVLIGTDPADPAKTSVRGVLLEPEASMQQTIDSMGGAEKVQEALEKFERVFSELDAAAKMTATELAAWEDDGGPAYSIGRRRAARGHRFANTAALRKHFSTAAMPKMIERLIGEGRIVLHEAARDIPGGPHPAGVQGATDAKGVIHLVATVLTTQTALPVLLHEVFHSGVEPLIGEKAWATLMGRTARLLASAKERADQGRTVGSQAWWDAALARLRDETLTTPEELAAYAVEHATGAPAGVREAVEGILGAVKAFILRRFGRQLGAVTPAELRSLTVAALRSGKVGAGPRPRGGMRYSTAAPGKAQSMQAPGVKQTTDAQMAEAERGLIGHALTRAMPATLGLVPGRPLFAELAKKMPAAQEYLSLKQQMDAVRNQWHARMDGTAQAWRKLIGRDGKANAELMAIMHEATLLGADPSKEYIPVNKLPETIEKQKAHAALRGRLTALPADFQAMFRTVRDDYKALNDEMEATLVANISRAIELGLRTAQRAHDAEIERISDEGLKGAEKAAAEAAAAQRLSDATYRHNKNRRARMADLRKKFETSKVPEPYFPLARFGSFFVTARDKETGEVVHFSRHQKPGRGAADAVKDKLGRDRAPSQAEVAAELREQGYAVEIGTIGETSMRDMVDPAFIVDVEAILESKSVPEHVMDAVWQRWLETMPDMSMRKNRIHRKGTAGYDTDAFRAFGHHVFHGAHQMARLKFAMLMQETLDLTKTQAAGQADPVRAGLVVEEMGKRHEYTMNPKGAWWSQAATSAAFVWYLSMTPAAAIVNLTQTTILGTPILAAAFPEQGIVGAADHLGRGLHDFTKGRGRAAASSRLTDDEKLAMKHAYESGLIDASQAHDLAGVGETGVEYSAVRTKIMAAISYFFHHTERMNREITFLAAYRMGMDAKLGHDKAIEQAGALTWKIHFDYQNTSRPRLMQNDVARVALVFRNFQVNMLYRLTRDVHQAVNSKDPAERKEAMTQLGGITGMLFLHAGVKGVWGFNLIMSIVGLFFAGGGDEAEDELKKGVISALGTNLGGAVLDGVPGFITGTSLTNRIGMPDLWFRSPDRQLEGEDEYNYWLAQMLGAAVGLVQTGFRGVQQLKDGDTWRGLETLAPKAVRDVMRAGRYSVEGVTTANGDDILENPGVANIIKQALGFTPAAVAERYDTNSSMKNHETRITDWRSRVLETMANAARRGEPLTDAMIADWEAYNAANPTYPIEGDQLRQSIRSRNAASARNEFGIGLNPKLNTPIRENAAPLVYE